MRLISNDINNLYNIFNVLYYVMTLSPNGHFCLKQFCSIYILSDIYICVLHKYNTYNERGVHTTYSIESVTCLNKKKWIYILLLVLILYTNFRYSPNCL